MIPICLEDQIVEGTFEFAIHHIVDNSLDMTPFYEKYQNDETGAPAFNPRIILKIVLFGYSRGLLSSRKIERACRENIVFIALACGQAPDHSTIAAFVCSMQNYILPIFRDILLVCDQENLLGGTQFVIDGCKLPSNASKQWSGTFAELDHKREKLEEKLKQLMDKHQKLDQQEVAIDHKKDQDKLKQRIKTLQSKLKSIQKWFDEHEPKKGQTKKELQSNFTDNDSAKMVTSHGVIQGYNGQAMVDDKHQIILNAEAMGNGQDYDNLTPMIDGAKENIKAIGYDDTYFENKRVLGDTNYHSETNLQKAKKEKLDAYIPDPYFRKRDPRFADQDRYKPPKPKKKFTIDDFEYDPKLDRYTCPKGKPIKLFARKSKIKGSYYKQYRAVKGACQGCPDAGKCMRNKTNKRKHLAIQIGKAPENLSKQMIEKVDTEKGRQIYDQRLAIIEPVFGNMREQKRMDRLTLRGKSKVNIQWMLYCMVHNIEKILNYGTTWGVKVA
jgi:transposase